MGVARDRADDVAARRRRGRSCPRARSASRTACRRRRSRCRGGRPRARPRPRARSRAAPGCASEPRSDGSGARTIRGAVSRRAGMRYPWSWQSEPGSSSVSASQYPLPYAARMNAATTSRFHSATSPASRQRSVSRRSMSSSSRSIRVGLFAMPKRVGPPSDGIDLGSRGDGSDPRRPGTLPLPRVAGAGGRAPARARLLGLRARLRERVLDGLSVGGAAARGRRGARHRAVGARAAVRLPGPPGRAEGEAGARRARPHRRDRDGLPAPRSSSSTRASGSGATGSRRSTTSSPGSETLRERLEQKSRAVPFGVEVMGRVSELGSIDDVARAVDAASRGSGR